MSDLEAPQTLASKLQEITAAIPPQIGERIDQAVAAIEVAGPRVGDRAARFRLPDANGREASLDDRLAEGPVIVTFYRGDWCPYCNLQLRSLEEALPRFSSLGASVVAISPQLPDRNLSLAERHELTFDVLSDLDQSVTEAYGLLYEITGDLLDLYLNVFQNDVRQQNADGTARLPVPGTFILSADGIVKARYASADWRTRVEPAEIEAVLADIAADS